ncbi:MAG: hypothetical protein ACLFVU_12690 [Phycisphaerae bacterium]
MAREEATRLAKVVCFLRFLFRLPLMLLAIAMAGMAAFLLLAACFRACVYLYQNFLKAPW